MKTYKIPVVMKIEYYDYVEIKAETLIDAVTECEGKLPHYGDADTDNSDFDWKLDWARSYVDMTPTQIARDDTEN